MAPVAPGSLVAVTGANGFIASHICAALLANGYRVRAVVRNPDDTSKTEHLTALKNASENLSFAKGDLLASGSYDEALAGVDAVIHAAAVVEIGDSKDPEKDIVRPSVDGVKNVLASADKAGCIKRFVHTSSVISTVNIDKEQTYEVSEKDWNETSTVANGDPYGFAKTAAEKTAHAHKGAFDLVSILPGVCLGPSLCKAHTKASVVIVRQMLYGNAQPVYQMSFVDVRDVAEAHVKALRDLAPSEEPRRYLLCSDTQMMLSGLEEPMRKLFPDYKINCVSSIGSVGQTVLGVPLLWRAMTTEFNRAMFYQRFTMNNKRSKSELGVQYRPLEETLKDAVTGMVDSGFVKARMTK